MSYKNWNKEEDEYMKLNYPDNLTRDLAKFLNRSETSVYQRATILGLRKSDVFLKSDISGRLTKLFSIGNNYRFKKGQKAHNKGKKRIEYMTSEAIEKAKQTHFQKNHLPHNTREDGDIRIQNDNGKDYQYIRVSLAKWKPLSHYNWEQINGPVPKGYNIVFKDGNTMNCDPLNLECISKKENMSRNSIMRYPKELIPIIRLNSSIKKQIKQQNEHNT